MAKKLTGKGAFRGVPFLIENEQSISGGRRLVTHEYPLREDWEIEDLGKKSRTYQVKCLVIGDDYIKQAEELIKALEAPGEGTLKHPFLFEEVQVFVDSYKTNYSTAHQRVVYFDISFLPVFEVRLDVEEDSLFSFLNEYTEAINALSEEFNQMIEQITSCIDSILENPLVQLGDSILSAIENVFTGINTVIASASEVKNKLLSMQRRINVLMLSPKILAQELRELTNIGLKTKRSRNMQVVQYRALLNTLEKNKGSSKEISQNSLNQISLAQKHRANVNQVINLTDATLLDVLTHKTEALINRYMTSMVLIEYGKFISDCVTDSLHQQAKKQPLTQTLVESKSDIARYMTELDDLLDKLIIETADVEQWQSYQALINYRRQLLNDLRKRASQLKNAVVVTLKDTQPVLVVEYHQNGRIDNWQRTVARNGIRHPLFCVGGNEIEVLQ